MKPSTPEPWESFAGRPLSATRPGEVVQVEMIVFDFIRSRCRELAIREGDRIQCLGRTSTDVVMLRADGKRFSISNQWARFIQVRTIPDGMVPGDVPAPDAETRISR